MRKKAKNMTFEERGIRNSALISKLGANKDGYFWIRIPKTGSQSIKHLLYPDIQYPHFSANAARDILGYKTFDGLFKFSFVRNPWNRLVTCYHYYYVNLLRNNKRKSFEHWIKSGMESPRLTHPLYPCSNKHNPFNQIGWLIDSDRNMLVDFIGRLENIDKDYETLSSKLNISYKKVPHLNISNGKKHYISYYTDELKNFVGDMYSEEISLLGYNFGGPNESID